MKGLKLSITYSIAAGCVLSQASAQTTFTIGNGVIEAEFEYDAPTDQRLQLKSIRDLNVFGQDIDFEDDSGAWSLEFRERGGVTCPSNSNDCGTEVNQCSSATGCSPGVGYCNLFTESWASSTFDLSSLDVQATSVEARWAGVVSNWTTPIGYAVIVRWEIDPGSNKLSASVEYVQDSLSSEFYLSRAIFPKAAVAELSTGGANDYLLIPGGSGLLYRDPLDFTSVSMGSSLDYSGFVAATVPLFGLYEEEGLNRCFYYSNDDTFGTYKEYNVLAVPGATMNDPDTMVFETLHLPPDIFDQTGFSTPYRVTLAPISGGWFDLVDEYRGVLTTEGAADGWYNGPVAINPNVSERAKRTVFQAIMTIDTWGDNIDTYREAAEEAYRTLGDNLYLRIESQIAWPDRITSIPEECLDVGGPQNLMAGLNNKGYLPGWPSGAAGARESQGFGNISLAPYYTSAVAVDPVQTMTSPANYTPLNVAALEAFVVAENGSLRPVKFPPSRPACLDSSAWRQTVLGQSGGLVNFLSTEGIYQDFFDILPCFNEAHADIVPGSGNSVQSALQLISDLKVATEAGLDLDARPLAVSMEFGIGYLSREFTYFLFTPVVQAAAATLDMNDPTRSAVVVPMFRSVHDDVKFSHIPKGPTPLSNAKSHGWFHASEVFNFGHILGNKFQNVDAGIYGRRDADWFRYWARITEFLRDDFFHWINGTMVRPLQDIIVQKPPGLLSDEWGYPAMVGIETVNFLDCYFEEPLVAGMFREAVSPHRLAFAVSNPVLRSAVTEIGFSASFDPLDYPDFAAASSYDVTVYDDDGNTCVYAGTTGPFSIAAPTGPTNCTLTTNDYVVGAGEIHRWVFEANP